MQNSSGRKIQHVLSLSEQRANRTSITYKLRKSKLSYTTARETLLSDLDILGLDKKKRGLHSLRFGGTTAAATAGVNDRLFKKHGRWKTDLPKMVM